MNSNKTNKYPARLHVVFASDAPLAVIFRRGPSKQVCTFLWNRKQNSFEMGQWLKGRIYERRSDLSPDGKYLLYFAMNGKWNSETKGSWTAVSKAPYLKAINLYKKGDCWDGGGLFLSKDSFWLNDRYFGDDFIFTESSEVRRVEGYVPEGGYSGVVNDVYFNSEDTGVYYRRLLRDGWTCNPHYIKKSKKLCAFEKKLPGGWILKKYAHEGGSGDGHGCYWDEYALLKRDGTEILCADWEWAERDKNHVVWASKGCLYRARIMGDNPLDNQELLHDFNSYTFEEVQAPY